MVKLTLFSVFVQILTNTCGHTTTSTAKIETSSIGPSIFPVSLKLSALVSHSVYP